MNYGKKFENNFKKGVGKELVRLYDTTKMILNKDVDISKLNEI